MKDRDYLCRNYHHDCS